MQTPQFRPQVSFSKWHQLIQLEIFKVQSSDAGKKNTNVPAMEIIKDPNLKT